MRTSSLAVFAMLLLLILAGANLSAAAVCNLGALQRPCAAVLGRGSPPSPQCCFALRQQLPCYCGYLRKYPSLRNLISPSTARTVSRICRIGIPRC
uniref:Lipid transfer protein homolog n=1 Tax=Gentiana triflora TaxID=55190 RepID=I7GY35_GENTR|nr:lipid transfer protein homolog [Gentiana triflora]